MDTIKLANIEVDNVTMKDALLKVEEFFLEKKPKLIVTPNPEIIVSCEKDEELKNIINTAALRLPDGISMVVVSKLLGKPLKERVTGIDFLVSLCGLAEKKGWKVFLLGSKTEVIMAAAENLSKKFPRLNIVGAENGFFCNSDAMVSKIKDSGADIVFAGLGGGKQERWLYENINKMGVFAGVGVGGSFDVLSGMKKRAPSWVQKVYLEWLYRLFTEPSRWKRQLALPKFLYITIVKYR